MLDIKFIRENTKAIAEAAKNKNIDLDLDRLLKVDKERRVLTTELEDIRAKRNELAKANQAGRPSDEQIEAVAKKAKSHFGEIDIIVHAIAYADRKELVGPFYNTSRKNWNMALEISAFSFAAIFAARINRLNDNRRNQEGYY